MKKYVVENFLKEMWINTSAKKLDTLEQYQNHKGHIRRAAIVLILASNTMLLIDVAQQTQPFLM